MTEICPWGQILDLDDVFIRQKNNLWVIRYPFLNCVKKCVNKCVMNHDTFLKVACHEMCHDHDTFLGTEKLCQECQITFVMDWLINFDVGFAVRKYAVK